MSTIAPLLILGLLAVFAWMTVWARRDTRVRWVAIVLFLLGVPLMLLGELEMLGWHKPLWAAWRIPSESRILAQKMIEGEGIYLYLDVDGSEPRAVVLPWSARTAERLQKAMRESARRGAHGALMERDSSLDTNEPKFYPLPQPRLPMPKGPPPAEPPKYDRGA